MNDNDRNLIAEYMGWNVKHSEAHVLGTHRTFDFYTYNNGFENIHFDATQMFKCANEMLKRKDWHSFVCYFFDNKIALDDMLFSAINHEYFFTQMATWIKEVIHR